MLAALICVTLVGGALLVSAGVAGAAGGAAVASTTPADSATNVPVDSSITIRFESTVALDPVAFSVVCTTSGTKSLVVSTSTVVFGGAPVTVATVDSIGGFAIGETCTVTVDYTKVHRTDGSPTEPSNYVFHFTTRTISDLLSALKDSVQNVGPGKALANMVTQIQADVAANDQADACAGLDSFIALVNAQTGKKLTSSQVASALAQATAIKTALGC
jgi:hypothetical protein